MNALMEAPQLSEPVPLIHFMQNDSFSRRQVTSHQGAESLDLFGAFIKPDETHELSSSADELNSWYQPPILSGMSDLRPKNQPSGTIDAGLNVHYVMSGAATIQSFVRDHRLRSTLLEARKHLDAAFGQGSIKKLEIIRDDEGSETLFCSVVVRDNLRQAKVALRRFDDEWWLGRIAKVAGKLNFDIELV